MDQPLLYYDAGSDYQKNAGHFKIICSHDCTLGNATLNNNVRSRLNQRVCRMVQQTSRPAPLTLRRRASNQPIPVCATADIRVQLPGIPVGGYCLIQHGTVSSGDGPSHCKPLLCSARQHNRIATAEVLPQYISAPHRDRTQVDRRKACDCSGMLQMQPSQNCPMHAAIPHWTTRLCWQTASTYVLDKYAWQMKDWGNYCQRPWVGFNWYLKRWIPSQGIKMAFKIPHLYTGWCLSLQGKPQRSRPRQRFTERKSLQRQKRNWRNWRRILGDLPAQRIGKQVGAGRRVNYVVQWYSSWPDLNTMNTVEQSYNIPQKFIVR